MENPITIIGGDAGCLVLLVTLPPARRFVEMLTAPT